MIPTSQTLYNSGRIVMGVATTLLLDVRPAPYEETYTWYCESTQKCMTGEVIDPRKKFNSLSKLI